MSFTFRDALWLTLATAIGLAWWVEHQNVLHQVETIDYMGRQLNAAERRGYKPPISILRPTVKDPTTGQPLNL
jgi:hypothetical protein